MRRVFLVPRDDVSTYNMLMSIPLVMTHVVLSTILTPDVHKPQTCTYFQPTDLKH